MSLLRLLLDRFRKPEKQEVRPLLSEKQQAELAASLKPLPPRPKGRVIKQTRHAEFNPDPQRTGGRIVKVMPRQLQKIKQAQEMVENDEPLARIED